MNIHFNTLRKKCFLKNAETHSILPSDLPGVVLGAQLRPHLGMSTKALWEVPNQDSVVDEDELRVRGSGCPNQHLYLWPRTMPAWHLYKGKMIDWGQLGSFVCNLSTTAVRQCGCWSHLLPYSSTYMVLVYEHNPLCLEYLQICGHLTVYEVFSHDHLDFPPGF